MRIKTTGTLFFSALALFLLLLALRANLHTRAIDALRPYLLRFAERPSSAASKGRTASLRIENILLDRFEKLETPRSNVSIDHSLEDSTIVMEAAIARGKPIEWVVGFICEPVAQAGYRVVDCTCPEGPTRCTIRLEGSRATQPKIEIRITHSTKFISTAARIAIVIADFGFAANETTMDLLSFPEPLTVSLVSRKKLATQTAQIANEYRKEIVILLPMEPLASGYRQYASEAILLHYPEEKVRSIIDDAVESVPFFAGFSNLCGSLLLDDSRIMKTVLTEVGKKHGYFLIDPVSHKSVAASLCRTLEVPYRTADIVLDSAGSCSALIGDTLRHAAMAALKTGSAVVQMRPTPQVVSALKEATPWLQRSGVRFVYLSEIVHNSKEEP